MTFISWEDLSTSTYCFVIYVTMQSKVQEYSCFSIIVITQYYISGVNVINLIHKKNISYDFFMLLVCAVK